MANGLLSLAPTLPQLLQQQADENLRQEMGVSQLLQNAANLRRQNILNQFLPQLQSANVKRAQMMAAIPGGQILPGAAGQAQGLQILAQRYGTESPIYQNAVNAFQSNIAQQKARAHFYNANYALKNLSPINKAQILQRWQQNNLQRAQQGLQELDFNDWYETQGRSQVPKNQQVSAAPAESSIEPLSTEAGSLDDLAKPHAPTDKPIISQTAMSIPKATQVNPQEIAMAKQDVAQTQASIQKLASDPQTRQKALNFQTINQIMSGVNPQMLAYYTAPKGVGLARLVADRTKALAGSTAPLYENYNNFIRVTVPTLADKIRQAYGTSITPEIFNVLKNLSNPVNWKNNPDLAISQWNKLTQLMREQGNIYNKAIGAPISETFTGQRGQQLPGQQIDVSGTGHTLAEFQQVAREENVPVQELVERFKVTRNR